MTILWRSSNALLLVILIFLITSSSSLAGSLKIKPVRIFLDEPSSVEDFELHNEGTSDLSLELTPVSWSQDNLGKNVTKPTDDLTFHPRSFTIPKGKKRVIRISLPKVEAGTKEKTYRILIKEQPVDSDFKMTGPKMIMEVSVPVFLAPARTKHIPSGVVSDINIDNCKVSYKVNNTGMVHIRLQKISVTGFDNSNNKTLFTKKSGGYVLPGISKHFDFFLEKNDCLSVDSIKVKIEADSVCRKEITSLVIK